MDAPTSLLLALPLFLLYQLGILLIPAVAGADLVTASLFALVGSDRLAYLGAIAIITIALLVTAWLLRRRKPLPVDLFFPVLLESGIYALTMGTFIVFVMIKLLQVDPGLASGAGAIPPGLGAAFVVSLGAGFYEELVFRQGAVPLLAIGATKLGARPRLALLIAALVAAVLFAIAHHVGPVGEPWKVGAFVYRMLAGLFFTALFVWRGFAVAAWTHALYDVYVMIMHG